MEEKHVLRLRRTDNGQPSHILLHVERAGSKTLDLKLIATEQEHLYHATLTEGTISSLRSSNYNGTLDEWKAVLQRLLLQDITLDIPHDVLVGLESVAAIADNALTITIRKNIGGITQRLGSLKLTLDDEREEVAFPEWVDTAVSSSDALRDQLATLQASMTEQQTQVTALTKQLDDLVTAKKDHEDELLKKFAALLNSKKLKIRDQQRLLKGAKIDPSALESIGGTPKKTAGQSRSRKRKANEASNGDDATVEDERDQADETATEDDEDEQMQEVTPEASDQDPRNGDNSDASGFEAAPAQSQASGSGGGGSSERVPETQMTTRTRPGHSGPTEADEGEERVPRHPASQEKKASSVKEGASQSRSLRSPPTPAPAQDEDEDETDDEL